MKKYLLVAVIVALSAFNLIGAYSQSVSADEQNFGCTSVRGCNGLATCGGPGADTGGCVIGCNNGGTLGCKRTGGEDPE